MDSVSDAIGSKLFLRPLLRVRRSHAMSSSRGVNAKVRIGAIRCKFGAKGDTSAGRVRTRRDLGGGARFYRNNNVCTV